MIYGYARCSTSEERQDIDRQKRELFALGVQADEQIYWEYESGTKTNRPELNKLLSVVNAGDTIVTTEVSRLTRSTSHLCEILSEVQENHLEIVIGSFVVDCRTNEIDPMTKGMLMMWGVFAEMERDIISQRVKSGMQNAKAKGKIIGRPTLCKDNIPKKFWEHYHKYQDKQLNVTDFAKIVGCSRTTLYEYLRVAQTSPKVV